MPRPLPHQTDFYFSSIFTCSMRPLNEKGDLYSSDTAEVSVTLPVGTGPAVTRVPGASDVFRKVDKLLTAPWLTLRRAA